MPVHMQGIDPFRIQYLSRFQIQDHKTSPKENGEDVLLTLRTDITSRGGLFIPGMDTAMPDQVIQRSSSAGQYYTVQIPIEFIVTALEELGLEKTKTTFGFRPQYFYDEFDVKWGNKALAIADKLKDNISSQAVQEAMDFMEASKLITGLRAISGIEDKSSFGFNPSPLLKEDKTIVDQAKYLSGELLDHPLEHVAQKVVDFLESVAVARSVNRLSSSNLRAVMNPLFSEED